MIVKLLGASLLTFSGIGTAMLLNRRATLGLRQTEGMMALLHRIKAEVDCFALPISEIFSRCESSVLERCGYCASEPPASLEVFLKGCEVYDEESVTLLRRFAEDFGKHYRKEQVESCGYYWERLEEKRGVLAAALPLRKKRNAVLCVCAALALSLILM